MTKLRIPSFSVGQKIVQDDGTANSAFLRALNEAFRSITTTTNSQDALLAGIAYSLQQAGIAVTTAQEVATIQALTKSYVTPSNILTTAVDTLDPTKAQIVIANHPRVYGDGTSKNVTGATLHGLAFSTQYIIVYSDPSRAGGAVSYVTRTDPSTAGQIGNQHLVGAISTPNSGGTGGGCGGTTKPPGVPPNGFPLP